MITVPVSEPGGSTTRLTGVTRTCLIAVLLLAAAGCGPNPGAPPAAPMVRIISPLNGGKYAQIVTIRVSISHFALAPGGTGQKAGTGQVWLYVNGHLKTGGVSTSLTLHLGAGTYTFKDLLVTNGKEVASSAPIVVTIISASAPSTSTSGGTPTVACATGPTPSHGLKAGTITWFCKGLPSGVSLGSLIAGPGGDLWLALPAYPGVTGSIGRITPSGVITLFRDGLRSGGSPGSLTLGPDGNVWFAETFPNGGTGAIGRITAAGAITMFARGLPAGSQIRNLAVGPGGNLWFTDCVQRTSLNPPCSPAVGRITPSGTITVFTKGMPSYSWPNSLVVGPDGNLWFTGTESAMLGGSLAIGRVTPSGLVTLFTKGLSAFDQLHRITVGPDGNLWFSANLQGGGPSVIGRVTPAGAITLFSTGLPRLGFPGRVVAGPDGNLWFPLSVTDSLGSYAAIGRITPSGTITLFRRGLTSGGIPSDLVAGADGQLWFTVSAPPGGTGAIGRITPQSGAITLFAKGLPLGSDPANITTGPGGSLWFTDQLSTGTGVIGRIIP